VKTRCTTGRNYSRWTFEIKGRMFGACGYAPIVQFYKEHLTQEKIDQLIIDCKDGKIILQEICQKRYY
jgi:NADH-quinone oxidoreductase subunit E